MNKISIFILLLINIAFVGYNQSCQLCHVTFLAAYREKDSISSVNDVNVRPFITDDSRVVGNKLAQLESWVRFDEFSGQHWALFAYGPNKNLELTLGSVQGYEKEPIHSNGINFSYGLPLLQVKYLLREYKPNKLPGIGMVLGTFLPIGRGSFRPPGYGSFGFITVTQSIGKEDRILLHSNIGNNYLHIDGSNTFVTTWGIGTQIKVYKGMHFVGEIFSGDPYIPGTGASYQIGFRYFFSDLFQIDGTVGKGFAGENILPIWSSFGVRIVTEKFYKRSQKKQVNKNSELKIFNPKRIILA